MEQAEAAGFRLLVFCGHLDVVDDEGLDGAFGRFEFEAELFLYGGEDVRGRIGIGGGRLIDGRPLEGEVVLAGEAGLVDDDAFEGVAELVGEAAEGHVLKLDHAVAHGDPTSRLGFVGWVGVGRWSGIGCGRFELGTAGGEDQIVDGEGFGFDVDGEMEALGEDFAKHEAALGGGELLQGGDIFGSDLGLDVKAGGVDPGRAAGDEVLLDVVGAGDEVFDGQIDHVEAVRGVHPLHHANVALVLAHGDDVEFREFDIGVGGGGLDVGGQRHVLSVGERRRESHA